MGRRSGGGRWVSVSLPPVPIRPKTPEERTARAAEWEAMADAEIARYLHAAELRVKRKERTTDAQRARKAAQDDVRKLRGLLTDAADAARWARIETALDGFMTFECCAKADALRAKVTQRTAKVYAKAAAGCTVSAEFIADESADGLYREAFNEPAAPIQQ